MRSRIHVNQHNIAANRKTGSRLPVLTVKTYKDNRKGDDVHIHGPSRLIYRPERPLNCGARVWIETDSPVTVIYQGEPVTPGSAE